MGGDVVGQDALVPGPNHSPKDRSLSVRIDPAVPGSILTYSFCGDDVNACRDYVREKLGLDAWQPERRSSTTRRDRRQSITQAALRQRREFNQPAADNTEARQAKARWLWQQRQPAQGTIVEQYLREARGFDGLIPATIGFLPARDSHSPAMICAFGMPTEPEPGVLSIDKEAIQAIHITRLAADGSAKAGTERDKIMIGSPRGLPIVLAPANDLLALAICEGIENALTVHDGTGLGAWAAGSATFMPHLATALPDYIESVTVVADLDQAGQRNSKLLIQAIEARGIEARSITLANGEPR